MPFQRTREQVAVAVGGQYLQNADGRQAVGVLIGLFALFQMTFVFQLAQQAFQVDPGRAFDPEGLGDVTLGGQGRIGGNPVEDLGF